MELIGYDKLFPLDADYYDCDDGAETLEHTDIDEAIEARLDRIDPLDTDQMDTPLTVYAFRTMEFGRRDIEPLPEFVLEHLLGTLDEDYGNPEDATKPTARMELAARAFIDAVLDEYEIWRCVKVGETIVNVREWIEKNRPDWLAGEDQ